VLCLVLVAMACAAERKGVPAKPVPGRLRAERILGGTDVVLGQDPIINFQVGLEVQTLTGGVERCGGSIIGPQHVLTAAHCLCDETTRAVNTKPTFITVIPGISWTDRSQARTAQAFWVHPTYLAGLSLQSQDLAVIRIGGANFSFSASVAQITLSTGANCPGCETAGQQYFVSGYGYTSSTSAGSSGLVNNLRFVEQQNVDLTTCNARLKANVGNNNVVLNDNIICAGPVPAGTSGKDSCAGDSGGPLFVQFAVGTNPRYVQVGIVSSGTEQSNPLCGVAADFGTYVGVQANLAYINSAKSGTIAPTAVTAAALLPVFAMLVLALVV